MESLPKANPADVESIEAIVAAAYDSISGPTGRKRDWDRMRSLFIAGARLIPTAKTVTSDQASPGFGAGGQVQVTSSNNIEPQILDVEGFIERVEPIFAKTGFYEKEIARRVEQFGQIAHVWSTCESRHDPNDLAPFMRGINSIQLFNDGNRWWILSIYWQHESSEHAIPEKYLQG